MCTAVTYQTKDFYFGRTLDHTISYAEEVTITPQNFPLVFRHQPTLEHHYAMIGMAHVIEDYPLYFDAVNERGLAAAGLNFVDYACYHSPTDAGDNVTHFELIPWLLARCASVEEVRQAVSRLNITDDRFNGDLAPAHLHWMVADSREAVVLESVREGLRIYHNPVGVLTNNPPFDHQLFRLNDFRGLSPRTPENRFSPELELQDYSYGMGGMGMPGDLSSQSRFVRAAFTRLHSRSGASEAESVNQFFHILGTVEQVRGVCQMDDGTSEITLYTSCCSLQKGIYYYTTYNNHQINAIHMKRESLDSSRLTLYPLLETEQIHCQN